MEGRKIGFIIPIYQRNYDWNKNNCTQLFDDLVALHKSGKKMHFFGSIVTSINSEGQRVIIDGQQRLTTVSLLLIALVNICNEGVMTPCDPELAANISDLYLVSKYLEGNRKIKLKPIKKDMEAFDALIKGKKEEYVRESNVTKNYYFLYDKIAKCGLAPDDILKAVEKLEVIDITLNDDDDPQLIFESLNSTGLDLSEADKIRNYLLMSLGDKEQDEMYENYWNPIEEKTDYEPSAFIRDFLTMKCRRVANEKRIYFEFKNYCQKVDGGKITVLKEMHHYAGIYHSIVNANMDDPRLDQKLRELDVLRSTVAYPYYMAFFNYADEKGLTTDDKYEVIDLIESYLIRRIICKIPSNALSKVFTTLHGDVLRIMKESNDERYIDALKYYLLGRSGSSSFPSDDEIKEKFPRRDVYNMDKKQRLFLFERMENRDSRERHDVVGMLTNKESKVSIEHIMPQTLSDSWKRELGPEWPRIHEQYLDTMANLTLTGYNSAYSNMPFIRKRDCEHGFNDSIYRLNSYVKRCQKWTEEELRTRQKEMLDVFLRLWPMPKTDFVPAVRQADTVRLDDEDCDFTNKKLIAYTYRGTRQTVKSWKIMLMNICSQVLQENRSTVEWLCESKSYNFTNEKVGRSIEELSPGLYVETNSSSESKINTLRHLFSECGVPQSELVFEFSQKTEDRDKRRDISEGQEI